MATQPSRSEANRLYWDTDSSVGAIAEELGVSRRALYELLDPIVADGPCPGCGQPLLFANRLARASGDASCHGCGTSKHVSVTPRVAEAKPQAPLSVPTARSRRVAATPGAESREPAELPPVPDVELPDWTSPLGLPGRNGFALRVAGVAALAVAAGVALAVILRRRQR